MLAVLTRFRISKAGGGSWSAIVPSVSNGPAAVSAAWTSKSVGKFGVLPSSVMTSVRP